MPLFLSTPNFKQVSTLTTSSLQRLLSRRMAIMLALGFSSGLPLSLTAGGSTMQAWLKDAQTDLQTIGRFALLGLPYALKFLWAPLLDAYAPPALTRRRGWAVLTQGGLTLSLCSMAYSDPLAHFAWFTLLAFAVAFFSASQDIVLDAMRTEMLSKEELGMGGSVYLTGYRLAMLVSGALALALSVYLSWRVVYLLMAALTLPGLCTVLAMSEPAADTPRPLLSLRQRVWQPFQHFFARAHAMEVLGFVMLYKLPTLMATALTTVFLLELGFAKQDIAAVGKVAGLIATIAGTLAGGALMVNWGVKKSLWTFGIAQALGGGLFFLLAVLGRNYAAMVGVIVLDNFLMGMGTAAVVGFMMSVCNRHFTATQYALLSSLTAFTRVILISPAGVIATQIGWQNFFIFSVLLGLPGLLLLLRHDRWQQEVEFETPAGHRLSRLDNSIIALFLLALLLISTEFVWGMLQLPNLGLWLGVGGLLAAAALTAVKSQRAARKPIQGVESECP